MVFVQDKLGLISWWMAVLNPAGAMEYHMFEHFMSVYYTAELQDWKWSGDFDRQPEQREVLCTSWTSTWIPHNSRMLMNPIWRVVPLKFGQATTPSGKRSSHVRMWKEVLEYNSAKILEVTSIAAHPLSQPKGYCWKSLHAMSCTYLLLNPITSACFFANKWLVFLTDILRHV